MGLGPDQEIEFPDGIHVDDNGIVYTIGGQAPVQANGMVDQYPFYFRARGSHWRLVVSAPGTDPVHAPSLWEVEQEWGMGMFSASWMPHAEADELIVNALNQFRVTHHSSITCAHCGRRYPRLEGQVSAQDGTQDLRHPDDPTLPDCYRLVTVYHEPVGARLPSD